MTSSQTTDHTTNTTNDQQADENALARKILLGVVVALIAWGLAIAQWGVPGLYIPALAMVPVIYIVLLVISRA
ncbi:hypothetical protein [Lacimonas salitolerans]|uniref:Uncharacterized protein n=1 Tax=Lacimonas salitolerans TaxID=1323750 RepID=A0ABW4EC56_9RHOB